MLWCPVCPCVISSSVDHSYESRGALQQHLTLAHWYDLVRDVTSGEDRVVPLSGDKLKRKVDVYLELDQRGQENAEVPCAGTCTSSADVKASTSSQPGVFFS